jgi:metallo-beta-lactamase class B
VLKTLPCDIFGAQHSYFFDMEAKVAHMAAGAPNPFIDPAGYRKVVADAEASYTEQLARERGRSGS